MTDQGHGSPFAHLARKPTGAGISDTEFTLLCGSILRGTTLKTSCDCAGLTVDAVMDYVEGDAARLNDLFAALIMRAHTTRVP